MMTIRMNPMSHQRNLPPQPNQQQFQQRQGLQPRKKNQTMTRTLMRTIRMMNPMNQKKSLQRSLQSEQVSTHPVDRVTPKKNPERPKHQQRHPLSPHEELRNANSKMTQPPQSQTKNLPHKTNKGTGTHHSAAFVRRTMTFPTRETTHSTPSAGTNSAREQT
eukprot:33589_6